MKTMTCKQLGGACDKEFHANTFEEIGPIAAPDVIHWAPNLPKTRSGKIMRRILRKIAVNEAEQLGDISTLADPSVVDNLKASYVQMFSS